MLMFHTVNYEPFARTYVRTYVRMYVCTNSFDQYNFSIMLLAAFSSIPILKYITIEGTSKKNIMYRTTFLL